MLATRPYQEKTKCPQLPNNKKSPILKMSGKHAAQLFMISFFFTRVYFLDWFNIYLKEYNGMYVFLHVPVFFVYRVQVLPPITTDVERCGDIHIIFLFCCEFSRIILFFSMPCHFDLFCTAFLYCV
eukprot:GEMP01057414.1.p1 GENE.GEMP01057414.1~~GEMP01057414.1.p1  ORF type:complete len:126 (+),score=0.83 GEMP01057414.1:892-1269(+)